MKQFSCGDVVPGCTAHFQGATTEAILKDVAVHAKNDHGMTVIPQEVIDHVLAQIKDISAN